MWALALLPVIAAAPLEVRVLERALPSTLSVDSARARCDGEPLATPMVVEASVRDLKVGERHCTMVEADAPRLTINQEERRYPGSVRVTLEGSHLRLVNVVDVEAYLPSVVSTEAGAVAPAALEAQAIVSRTFALAQRHRHQAEGYGLCDLAHCQAYSGGSASKAATRAVEATRGQVLLVGGVVLAPAFFHAACGGHTSTATDVFGARQVSSAVSDLDDGVPNCGGSDFAWSIDLEREPLASALGLAAAGSAFEPLRRDQGGRVLELRSFGKRMSGEAFLARVNRSLGWQTVKSLKLRVTETDTVVHLEGTGFGHGVGLCQRGAAALAARGRTSAQILRRYFPESRVGDAALP